MSDENYMFVSKCVFQSHYKFSTTKRLFGKIIVICAVQALHETE